MNVPALRERIKARSIELNIRPAHDESGHWYEFEGQKYTSVTTRLQVLKDPGLMNWKMNRALDDIRESLNGADLATINLDALIERAKLAPQLEFEGAGQTGTEVHNWREQWFNSLINNLLVETALEREMPFRSDNIAVISACRAINKFVKDTNYIPLACELYLADHKLHIGGTLDDIGIIGNDLVLIDLKTSNIGNKDSYYAQICLYLHMFRKLYRLYPQKIYILHVSKENGFYELIPLHDRVDINKTIRWATKVVQVSEGLDELKETKKRRTFKL